MRESPKREASAEALRDATARTIVTSVRALQRIAAWLAVTLTSAARWAWPRLRRAGGAALRLAARSITGLARWSWAHRVVLARVGQRAMWWVALGLLIVVGRGLFGLDSGLELAWFDDAWFEHALAWLIAGLALAGLVLLSAPEARLRRAAFVLAGAHGSLALLVWVTGA